jgi:methyl-accepting chemotaxis protein
MPAGRVNNLMVAVRLPMGGAPGEGIDSMRRWHVTTRIVALLLVGVAVASVLIAIGSRGFAAQQRASQLTSDAVRLASLAGEAKFRTADVAGWQTGYAFDFIRGLPDATSDTAGQRKEFLASAAALDAAYTELAAADLTAHERELLSTARAAFAQFRQIDDQIIAGYRAGTPQRVAAASALASGASLDAFGTAATATSDLFDDIRQRALAVAAAARAQTRVASLEMWLVGGLGLLVALLVGGVVVRSIARPLSELRGRLVDIADGEGDLTARLAESGRDELTAVAAAFNRFVTGIGRTLQAVDEQSRTLAATAHQLTAASGAVSAAAAESARRAGAASGAADGVSQNVQLVAAGTEQMGASIGEIAQSTSEATRAANGASQLARSVTDTVAALEQSSRQIGDIAKVISGIAQQTNLLALNATIEAARAGEAGKGFAVVAGEVKDLAHGTGTATEDITSRIVGIQHDTSAVVSAIDEIARVITRVNDLQSVVASAIDEQTATTAEMARSLSQAADGSASIAREVAVVADSVGTTTARADEMRSTAGQLSDVSNRLQELVSVFRY